MIFNTPISWFLNEILSLVLFLIVLSHALKQEKPFQRILELFGYMLAAGIFENIGVWQNIYYYSLDRIMMFGKVPVSILLLEGVIFYAAMMLVERLSLPTWAKPAAIGVLASIQDMTLDPASVFDMYSINGVLEGQWNWTKLYDGGFVNIPFMNFSGWLTMMLFFSMFMYIGRHMHQKNNKKWFGVAYPFFSTILTLVSLATVNQFLLYGAPFFQVGNKTAELVFMIINFGVSIFLLLRFACYNTKSGPGGNGIMFSIPIALHVYSLAVGIIFGVKAAILPAIIVGGIHTAYLLLVRRKLKSAGRK